MLLIVKYLSHETVFNTIKPVHSKLAAFQKILSPTTEIELMKFNGSMTSYFKIIDKLHFSMKALYDLLHDKKKFHKKNELETLFQQIITNFTKNVTPTLPNTNHPFFNTITFL